MPDPDVLRRLAGFGFGKDVELPVGMLVKPEEFQRKLKPRRWAFFIPCLFGRLIIAEVNGVYYVVDGQHRLERAILDDLPTVPCVLFHGMTMADAAAMFDICNSERVALNGADEFRAACIAEDAQALELDAALLARGLDGWCRNRASRNLSPINSVRLLQTDHGIELPLYTLDVLGRIWPWEAGPDSDRIEVEASPHVRCIRGFGQYLRPEKKVTSMRTGRKSVRRWKRADEKPLVAYMARYYCDKEGLENWLMKAEQRRRGGGGGGGSLGMELLLSTTLTRAKKWYADSVVLSA